MELARVGATRNLTAGLPPVAGARLNFRLFRLFFLPDRLNYVINEFVEVGVGAHFFYAASIVSHSHPQLALIVQCMATAGVNLERDEID
ncbi:MAG: hypothetical protein ABIA59_02605 [Candidatus Latescibacterota bacterium]